VANDPFETFELVTDSYVLLVPSAWTLASRSVPVCLEELGGLPLIGQGEREVRVEAALAAAGIHPRFVFRSDVGRTVQGLVAVGLGAALLPRLGVEPDLRTSVLELEESPAIEPRRLGLAWLRDRSHRAAASRFVDAALRFSASLS